MGEKKTKKVTNIYGANQHKPDPRQEQALANYLNPKSPTFGNALQSFKKAGYSEEYSKAVTSKMPTWLAENVKDINLVKKAERNLNEFLDDDENKKIKADITKFISERLNKKKYSKKIEHTLDPGDKLTALMAEIEEEEENN